MTLLVVRPFRACVEGLDRRFRPGDRLNLPEEAAGPLLRDGVAVPEGQPIHYPGGPDRPVGSCALCRTWSWWQRRGGGWICGVCHPGVIT